MLLAFGAASSAIDSLFGLVSPKQTPSAGSGQDQPNLFAFQADAATTSTGGSATPTAGGGAQIAPETMSALLAAQSQSGTAFQPMSRQDALKKMADRAATPEVSSFARAIIQADQLGTSLGRILRVQAADSRLKRQAAAEEKAMKAPIKMLFPTVMFIFPAMFLVILGPAFLNLSKIF